MGFFYTQTKTRCLQHRVFYFPNERPRALGKIYMPEIITVILQKVEVLMETYGFWKTATFVLLAIILWQLPNIINSVARLLEVLRLR